MSKALFMSKRSVRHFLHSLSFCMVNDGPIWYRGLVRTDEKYKPLENKDLQEILKRYKVGHIIVGHTIFKDISTFYNGQVIGVNVDNKENREKKRGRAVLIEGNTYYVVGDAGIQRKLY